MNQPICIYCKPGICQFYRRSSENVKVHHKKDPVTCTNTLVLTTESKVDVDCAEWSNQIMIGYENNWRVDYYQE